LLTRDKQKKISSACKLLKNRASQHLRIIFRFNNNDGPEQNNRGSQGSQEKAFLIHVSYYDTSRLAHVAGFETEKDFCCAISFGNVFMGYTYCPFARKSIVYYKLLDLISQKATTRTEMMTISS